MENNLENKAKFFAIYLDQEVYCIEGWNRGAMICDAHKLVKEEFYYLNKSFLILKPLSSISDEDAIEVVKIMTFHDGKGLIIERKKHGEIEMYDRYNDEPHFLNTLFFVPDPFEIFSRDDNRNWFQYDAERILEVTDFLRSRGYALPWMGLSVEEQVNRGWVKLKGETK